MEKIPTTIRIREDQLTTIKELNINLSEWVREKLDDEFVSLQEIRVQIKNTQKKLKKLQENEANVIQCNTENEDFLTINDKNREFLLETKVLLETKPEFLEGRIELYKRTFYITRNITKKQFFSLLKELEKELK